MSYNITLTNGNVFAVIPDGTLNTNSSMTLIGRNVSGYGAIQDDNFIRLLECGSNDTAPTAPLTGQLWYNSSSKILEVYNGKVFKSVSGATSSASAPGATNNSVGDLWYDTINQQLNVWSGDSWVLVGPPSSGGTGAVPATLFDGVGTEHNVLELTVDGNIVGIISQSVAFSPVPSLDGFGNVYPGLTLSTLVNNQVPQFTGTATSAINATNAINANNATTVNGLSTSSFMRTDQDTSTTGNIRIINANGLFVGNNGEFTANVVSNSVVNLYNNAANGNLNIGINRGGTKTAAVLVEGATGNVTVTGNLTVQGTTTTVNSNTVTTNDLLISVANNASTPTQANGGGLGVGPAGSSYATLTFNSATTAWNMSVPLSVVGTISTASSVSGGNLLTTGVLSVGGTTTLTGVATAPTAVAGTNNTQIATTSFVRTAVNNATGSLGTMSTQNASSVAITGGTISGLATPLPVSSGGTGLSSPGNGGNVLISNGSGWQSASLTASGIKLGLGITGEVWNDVTGSRSQGVTYTNSYSYPIQVQGNFGCNGGGQGYIYINGTLISFWQAQFNGCGGYSVNMPCIVPPGATYMLANMGGGARGWYELY